MFDVSRIPRTFEEISKFNSYESLKRKLRFTKNFKKLRPLIKKLLDFSITDMQKRLHNKTFWFKEKFLPFLDLDILDFNDFLDGIEINLYSYIRKDNISYKDQEVVVIGDLHGNFRAFNCIIKHLIKLNILNSKLKLDGNYRLVFLGDFIDRGKDSLNIIITLMFLTLFNPENVIILRGNHEDKNVFKDYGFTEEFRKKLYLDFYSYISFKNKFNELFRLLPTVYFIKRNDDIFMFNHAGTLNSGEDNKKFEIVEKERNSINNFLVSDKTYLGITDRPILQFLWNDIDFSGQQTNYIPSSRGGNIYTIPLNLAFDWMKDVNIKYKFMGHMHTTPKGNMQDISEYSEINQRLVNEYISKQSPGFCFVKNKDNDNKIFILMSGSIVYPGIEHFTIGYAPSYLLLDLDSSKVQSFFAKIHKKRIKWKRLLGNLEYNFL